MIYLLRAWLYLSRSASCSIIKFGSSGRQLFLSFMRFKYAVRSVIFAQHILKTRIASVPIRLHINVMEMPSTMVPTVTATDLRKVAVPQLSHSPQHLYYGQT
jgi:hypothetical protein